MVTPSSPLHILVCDYAAVNADGTCTIVRGGTERWEAPSLPGTALAWVYAETEAGALQVGDHSVEVSIINDQEVVLASLQANVKLVQQQRARFAVPLSVMVQAFGDLRVVVKIGPLSGSRIIHMEKKAVGEVLKS